MSWRRALAYAALGAVLATVYLGTAPPEPVVLSRARAPEPTVRSTPAIDAVHVEAGGRTIDAVRAGELWQITHPAGGRVPSDLISALISAVLETPAEPVASGSVDVAEFGLDTPSARVRFTRPGAAPVTVLLGSVNAAETGVYGRLDGTPQVLLLGLNVRYYVDLVVKQATS
jgi:hypothetical protein